MLLALAFSSDDDVYGRGTAPKTQRKNVLQMYRIGLPDAFCKNTGHLVNSARSKLCRNS